MVFLSTVASNASGYPPEAFLLWLLPQPPHKSQDAFYGCAPDGATLRRKRFICFACYADIAAIIFLDILSRNKAKHILGVIPYKPEFRILMQYLYTIVVIKSHHLATNILFCKSKYTGVENSAILADIFFQFCL